MGRKFVLNSEDSDVVDRFFEIFLQTIVFGRGKCTKTDKDSDGGLLLQASVTHTNSIRGQ